MKLDGCAPFQTTDRLASLAPFEDAKVIFGSGGSEAVDTACKLARRHWQREGRTTKKIILSRNFSYHGIHGYGTSIAGLAANREGYGTDSLIPETARVDHLNIQDVAVAIDEIGADNIAAIILEPIMGTGGIFPPPAGYLEGVQKLAAENDILIIADEVISGFGRAGTMFACERFDFMPDMLLMAKGITSGYAPLGGILVSARLWRGFYESQDAPVYRHGTTYAGHATACAVAWTHLDLLEQENLVPRAGELEVVLDSELNALRGHELVSDVRIGGFLAGVELDESVSGEAVSDYALDHGVILRVLRGNTLQISPPFIVTKAEIATIVSTIRAGIDAVGAGK